ncbi:prepilin-type N-terminal cleavage/methylation domain-containing protein [Chloroflexota bacterium]
MRWLRIKRGEVFQGAKGFTFIEVIVGVAIFAVIGVAVMNGLSTGYKTLAISQERTYAESLAKSQVEYIKAQPYISVANYNPIDNYYAIIDIPAHLVADGYSVEINDPETVDVAGISGNELEGITIEVKYQGSVKFTITFYRVGMAL